MHLTELGSLFSYAREEGFILLLTMFGFLFIFEVVLFIVTLAICLTAARLRCDQQRGCLRALTKICVAGIANFGERPLC